MNILAGRYKGTTASAFAIFKLVQVNFHFSISLKIIVFSLVLRRRGRIILRWCCRTAMASAHPRRIVIHWHIGLLLRIIR